MGLNAMKTALLNHLNYLWIIQSLVSPELLNVSIFSHLYILKLIWKSQSNVKKWAIWTHRQCDGSLHAWQTV